MLTIALVACVAKKLDQPAPAQELYSSPWFRLARSYAEFVADEWFILSAKYVLLKPTTVIEPYDVTLHDFPIDVRSNWSKKVMLRLIDVVLPQAQVIVLAGKRYREFLVPLLVEKGYKVKIPMEGLGIGQQMKWLKDNEEHFNL